MMRRRMMDDVSYAHACNALACRYALTLVRPPILDAQEAQAVKLTMNLNGSLVDALTSIVHKYLHFNLLI
jgi:hypothetical protein